jgi:outer membrane protein assembly factor BamB
VRPRVAHRTFDRENTHHTDSFETTAATVRRMVPALTRRRSLVVGGGALLGSALLSPDRLRTGSTTDPPDAETWAGPGGGPARTSHAPGAMRATELEILWRHPVGRPNRRGTAVALDTESVYAPTENGLTTLAADDGETRWRLDAEPTGLLDRVADQFRSGWPVTPRAGPRLRGDSLYVGTTDVRRLSAGNGDTRWAFSVGSTLDRQVVTRNTVLVADSGDELVALDATTGFERWRQSEGGVPMAADAGVVVTCDDAGTLAGYDVATGERLWQTALPDDRGWFEARVAVAESRLFVGGGRLVALGLQGGRRLWTAPTDVPSVSAPAVAGGTVVGCTGETRQAIAFDTESGTERWRLSDPRVTGVGPSIAGGPDGTLYVPGTGGLLLFDIAAVDGPSRRTLDGPPEGPPALVGDRVVVRVDGALVGLEASR